MTGEPPLLLDRRGPVLLLTLNRPAVHNAVNRAMATAMGEALEQAAADEQVRAVVVAAGGDGAFCSGADLKEVAAGRTPNAEGQEQWGFLGLVNHWVPQPVIAAVTGSAYAGGAELLLACDLVVADQDAQLVYTEIRHGLFPSMGGTVRLAEHVGTKVAFEWMATARPVSAREAWQRGLVNLVAPRAEVLTRALDLAADLASRSPEALHALKRAFYTAVGGERLLERPRREVSDAEWHRLRAGEAGQAGPRAFAEGRRVRW
ncbi:enoyl-CoA hydratase/isomerase family protein [Nocardioides humi]|uniref:Crotonase/enoyl-CoA hydratase family protein n=1 Tax=Nocardioides humi TaxID=449461 RepID=A0ABN2AEH7_9ACTN|nr:enoyl-CoA hydratase/isomerase family protein [Nocardioides humi]